MRRNLGIHTIIAKALLDNVCRKECCTVSEPCPCACPPTKPVKPARKKSNAPKVKSVCPAPKPHPKRIAPITEECMRELEKIIPEKPDKHRLLIEMAQTLLEAENVQPECNEYLELSRRHDRLLDIIQDGGNSET